MTTHSPFSLQSILELSNLYTTVQLYQHPTGALHIHFANDDEHRGFCVGFRTSPEDSTGLPHILEHTALCGSAKYPVRDPFFMMLRRSLQTFMNAMTYPDRTCYPFATQNLQDFNNLLSIYLDASFAPQLDAMDFAQEGWRLAPNDDGSWAIKGVVYNEMKGAMGDSDSQVWDAMGRALLPDTCYRHNSGGSPAAIPSLRHEDLVAFHQRTYCAANACFTTWGDLDCAHLHEQFDQYCQRFPGQAVALPELQSPLDAAQQLDIPVPLTKGQDPRDATLTGITWVLGDTANLDNVLIGELADQLLVGHAAAPLRLTLEQSQLGRSASGSGYHAYLRNGMFGAELQGMDVEKQDQLDELVTTCLEQLTHTGFSQEDIDSALHQLELRRRHIGGDGMPFGLMQCLRATGVWCSGGDILAALDQDAALSRLREVAGKADFWPSFIRSQLLENTHRLHYRSTPNVDWAEEEQAAEQTMIAEKLALLDDADKAALAALDKDLDRRQQEGNDPGCLPQIDMADIPQERRFIDGDWVLPGIRQFKTATNGLLSCYAAIPLGDISEADIEVIQTAVGVVGRLGFGDNDYQETARLLDSCCGGVSARVEFSTDTHDTNMVRGYLFASIVGLDSRADEWLPFLPTMLLQQRFDETTRLKELLLASFSQMNDSLLSAGNRIAAGAAQRSFPGNAGLQFRLNGLGRREQLKNLLEACEVNEQALAAYAQRAEALLRKILKKPAVLALVSDRDDVSAWGNLLQQHWPVLGDKPSELEQLARFIPQAVVDERTNIAFTTATPVSFNALALQTVGTSHPDSAALSVACRLLSHEQLHRQIREQGGAYGSGASWGPSGSVVLSSYRDPRLLDTFTDLEAGLSWLQQAELTERAIHEAKLALIAGSDSPLSPSGEARRRFMNDLQDNSPESLNKFRKRLLQVTAADIRNVAQKYFSPDALVRATLTSTDALADGAVDWPKVTL